MDISRNAIDLLYLTNANTFKTITSTKKLNYTKEDLDMLGIHKYKRRKMVN